MVKLPGENAIVECITGITSMATRHVVADLAAAYAERSGQCVEVESVGGVDAARRIENGEVFDFTVLASDAIDKLVAAGRVDPGSRVALAQSGMAVAVRAGARHPDISDEKAVRAAVLAARSVGYSTGPSGRHVAALFQRWGIADLVAKRCVEAPPGVPVGGLVARGEVEIGFQQSSELVHIAGIDIVGTLPADVQVFTVFAAAICASSSQAEAARALLSFLTSQEAEVAKRRNAMEPITGLPHPPVLRAAARS